MAISLLTFTAVVFRAEVALLLGPLAIQCLYHIHIPRQDRPLVWHTLSLPYGVRGFLLLASIPSVARVFRHLLQRVLRKERSVGRRSPSHLFLGPHPEDDHVLRGVGCSGDVDRSSHSQLHVPHNLLCDNHQFSRPQGMAVHHIRCPSVQRCCCA